MDEGGLVWFAGRRDTQIKSRGYRIELGEVENALNAVPGLKECAVVGVETGGFEGIAICGAYATGNEVVRPAAVRKHLATLVPQYMIPSHWLALEVLPKNVNGKIDRRLLKENNMNRKLVIAALTGLTVATNAVPALAGELHRGIHHAWDRGGSNFGFGVGFVDKCSHDDFFHARLTRGSSENFRINAVARDDPQNL